MLITGVSPAMAWMFKQTVGSVSSAVMPQGITDFSSGMLDTKQRKAWAKRIIGVPISEANPLGTGLNSKQCNPEFNKV